jgi:hypothetical protein
MTVAQLSHLRGVPRIKRVPFGMHATATREPIHTGRSKDVVGKARCAELAVAVRLPQLRTTFLELSKNWEKLAIQPEDAFAKLTETAAVGSNVRDSLNETKRLSNLSIWKR